jgi:acylphosphatase
MPVCKRVLYWGKVQGVGFRYTVQSLARSFPVTGYVKNMLDGQVELVAEGDAADVDRLLQAVADRMAGYIKGQSVQDESPQGFVGFDVRF